MPVNYQTPAASQLLPVPGVRLGIAEAGIRKANRRDLLLIELATGSRVAGVFTRNGARALRVTKRLRAGIVWVNTYRVVSPIAAFGGVKGSGYGRESGFQALYDYTRPKTIWVNTSSEPIANPFVMR